MRERILRYLIDAGFTNVDTNRWAWHSDMAVVFRISFAHREWTVTYELKGEPEVRRWRLKDEANAPIPKDLTQLLSGLVTGRTAA